jgi:hypothetical protein
MFPLRTTLPGFPAPGLFPPAPNTWESLSHRYGHDGPAMPIR